MFDDGLRLLESLVGNNFVTHADYLLVVIEEDNRRKLEAKGQRIVDLISNWYTSAKLELTVRNVKAIALKNGMINRTPVGRRRGA